VIVRGVEHSFIAAGFEQITIRTKFLREWFFLRPYHSNFFLDSRFLRPGAPDLTSFYLTVKDKTIIDYSCLSIDPAIDTEVKSEIKHGSWKPNAYILKEEDKELVSR